ncbi:MAG TPA: CoA transferase [Dehalococcoidia bacterium]|nr:CoA transferase [Dehalococcoidia bacterium]
MLSGYRVLDLCDERGFVAGQILADLGADVIAVEPPGGSPARRLGPFAGGTPDPENSLQWWAYSRNKRSVCLDLDEAVGREQFLELVRTADFLFESGGPGFLESHGLGWEILSEENPRLIVVSITAFGLDGPKAGWPVSDLTAWAASGALLVTGDPDRPPVYVGLPQAYLHAGADAALAAMVAHEARLKDGLGQRAEVSAQTSAMATLQSWCLPHGWNDIETKRIGGGFQLGPLNMRFIYPCADGHVLITFLFGNALGPFTRRLMEWMCEDGVIDEVTRDKDWVGYAAALLGGEEPLSELDRLQEKIEEFCLRHTKDYLFDGAMARTVLLVPVSTIEDVMKAQQLEARGFWTEVDRDGTVARYPGPFARFSATPISYRHGPPTIGQHTEEVLREKRQARAEVPGPAEEEGSALPLEGVKVLDFTWAVAGPATTRALADYGATVVRIESTTRLDSARTFQPYKNGEAGPENSACYADVNAGKLDLSLNMSKQEARDVAKELARWADVVIENYSPGTMERMGLSYAALRETNPQVIMLSSSLNGQDGPHGHLAGFGTLGAAMAGFTELAGWPDRAPAGPFLAYTDYMVPRYSAASILAALDHRRRTGEGQYIDLSQTENALHFLAPSLLDYSVNGVVGTRDGNRSSLFVPHGVYPCEGDDRWVAIVAETDDQWRALARAIQRPDLESDPDLQTLAARASRADQIDSAIGDWTATHEVDDVEVVLVEAGVPVHRVSSSADCFADAQLIAREHFPMVDHAVLGQVPLEAPRFLLHRTPPPPLSPHPTFGEHNDEVLRGILGYGDERVAALASAGALE